jgi:hypothetical protein
MTEPFDEYGDRLRRVLHTEAEEVVPSPEGLENIRTKIDRRRERRLWYVRPWLRPLAAVSAALVMSIIAVPATAAFKNFVQTGHFSPDSGHDGGRPTVNGRHTYGQTPPGPVPSDTRLSPRPSSGLSTRPGSHVVTGSCPPGEGEVSQSGAPSESPSLTLRPAEPEPSESAPRVTCQPGTSTSSPSPHTPSTPPDSGTAQPPASEPPTGGSQPSAQSSP